MHQRAAVGAIFSATSFLTLLALSGHSPLSGHQVVTIGGDRGVNTGDVLPLGAGAVVTACCLLIWSRAH